MFVNRISNYDVDEDRESTSIELHNFAKWLEMKKLNYELTRRFD